MTRNFEQWFASMPVEFQKTITDGKHVYKLRSCFVAGMSAGVNMGVRATKQKISNMINGIKVNPFAFEIFLQREGFTDGEGI